MEDFTLFFKLGWYHILSLDALDHILFIATLTCLYNLNHWKQVLFLITAFTIGHSLTLAISSYNIIRFNNNWIEFLIPLTILSTAIFNLAQKEKESSFRIHLNYLLALCFGLVHGMGFANTIRFMLAKAQTLTVPLVSFNLGIEAGQILFVIFLLYVTTILTESGGLKQKWWTIGCSVISGIIAIYMCAQRWPF